MIIIDCIQNTPEWHAAKCGIPSSSNFHRIITTKGEPSKQRQKYLYQLAGERITGKPEQTYQSEDMQRGIEMESETRALYEFLTDKSVRQVGVCFPDEKKLFAASPDGLVNKGLLEIKCPTLAVHVGYLLGNKLPLEYFQQVQGQLLVTGCKWCDFMSYFPGIKPFIFRVERDKKFIALLEMELKRFCADLKKVIKEIK